MNAVKRLTSFVMLTTLTCAVHAGEVHEAAEKGNLERVKSLIATDSKLIEARDGRGLTPLHCASMRGRKGIVEFLLTQKATIDAKSKLGDTPLTLAALNNHEEVATILLNHDADINATDNNGWTAVHWAVLQVSTDTLKVLLSRKPDLAIKTKDGKTALALAKELGFKQIARILREHGAKE